jgi:hypothetical protein
MATIAASTRVRVRGLSDPFPGVQISGDQAALHDVLAKIRDLGLSLEGRRSP